MTDPVSPEGATASTGSVDGETDPDVLRVRALLESRLLGTPPPATRVGRFIVIERLGAGAMGVVYAAYDPQLDRKVALKLLSDGDSDPDKRARLLGEARALARLAHPNVVGVYEVGEHQQRVFIAMEYLRGDTLRTWARERPRPWREVLATCCQAGRGLAAAHASGIVHRDFKPDNVLIADDPQEPASVRARVLDFGLARDAVATRDEITADDRIEHDTEDALAKLTRTGARVGTPAYMAPEQFEDAAVTEAADQFAFCVSLWECLYGERPFAATSVQQLIDALARGRLREPPRDRGVPGWIRAALARGLSTAPGDRWPSMTALLGALAQDPARRRRRLAFGIGAAALVVVATAGAEAWWSARAQRCSGASQRLAGVWDDARRDAIDGAFTASNVAFATDAFSRAATALDAYAERWASMHTESCEATTVRGEQSADLMDRRTACLERARTKLAAAVDVLADADAEVVRKAHVVVEELAPLERCADVDALRAEVEPPLPEEAERVDDARALLAKAEAEQAAGRFATAREQVVAAGQVARAVVYPPVHAEIALDEGLVAAALGDYEQAAAVLHGALALAARSNLRETMRLAVVNLVAIVGAQQERFAEALQFRELALALSETPAEEALARQHIAGVLTAQGQPIAGELELRGALAAVARMDAPEPELLQHVHLSLAGNLYHQGRFIESEQEVRIALELAEQTLGPGHPDLARARGNLAIALAVQGKLGEAEQEFRGVLALLERALGPEHPDVANAHNNLGNVLEEQGRYAEAEAETRRAIASWEASLGPNHPSLVLAHTNLSAILYATSSFDESLAEARLALATAQTALGPEAPEVGHAHARIAAVFEARREYADAEREYRRALALEEQGLGSEHEGVAVTRMNLGAVLAAEGKLADAEVEIRGALATFERVFDPEQPKLSSTRVALAKVLVDQQREPDALPFAELGWTRTQRDDLPPETQAEAAFQLARAIWGSTRDRADRVRARELATRSLDAFNNAPPHYRDSATFVRDWLAAHPLPR